MKKLKFQSPSKKVNLYDDGFDNKPASGGKKRLKPVKRIRKQDIYRLEDEF